MAQPGKQLLHDLEAGMAGQPRRPPAYRRTPAWVLLAVALTMLVTGLVLPQALLLAAGLVTVGVALHLLSSPHRH